MKKVLLLSALAIFGLTLTSDAQKQIGGDKNFEVNFAPLGGNPINMNGIKFRYFTSEEMAIRVEFFLGGSNEEMVTSQAGESDEAQPVLKDMESSFSFSIRPGIEKHLDGTDRMSPYIGAFIDFTTSTEKSSSQGWGPNSENDLGTPNNYVTYEFTEVNGSTTFGINAVAGMDYYFADNFYAGVELGFGFASTNEKDTEFEIENPAAWGFAEMGDFNADKPSPLENGKMSAWGPNVNGLIRLGYLIN